MEWTRERAWIEAAATGEGTLLQVHPPSSTFIPLSRAAIIIRGRCYEWRLCKRCCVRRCAGQLAALVEILVRC